MRKPMCDFDRKVLDWFTSLDMEEIELLTKKHFGDLPTSLLNGELVTEMYVKEIIS